MARYKQLLYFASKLEGLDESLKVEDNKVQGCVSQVWVVPEHRDGKMYWKADSDAQLTKGLAALLVQGLSGCTPHEVCSVEPDFVEMLGLKQSLTPSRNNGFLNMFKLMQSQALGHVTESDAVHDGVASASQSGVGGAGPMALSASVSLTWEPTAECPKPVAASMDAKLRSALAPVLLEIADESASHAGHAGVRDVTSSSGETHFKVSVVSERFQGLNTVQRHRRVYELLADELAGPVHALSLSTKTPDE